MWLLCAVCMAVQGACQCSLPRPILHGHPACHAQTSLGIVLGLTYIRSRNLLTPMLIHGAW